ncbi:hypothetical protein PRIC1_008570 [Phytophthora ramorum]
MRGEGQRLSGHLKAAFAEIERLKVEYRHAINQLEKFTLTNLSPQSAAQWFEMYLRVVDVGVQIRRGEIRHRTVQRFTYMCMHKTGTKGAVHSGLSIDDGNAIFQLMESRKLVKESLLDDWFMKMDGLDRDDIGLLDKRVSGCLEDFRRRTSMFYDRLEVTGEDPHEEMLVLGGPAPILAKVTRTCFGPENCSCTEDAKPWENFCLKPGDPHAQRNVSAGFSDAAGSAQADDVGIMDIKRQMGFQELSREQQNEDAAALARDAAELARRRRPQKQYGTVGSGIRVPSSARSIYQKKCEENGSKPKAHILAILVVKNGAHLLDLSGIGFHSVDDLQDLVNIFSTPGLPPVKELDLANGFFNGVAFQVLCQLLRVPQLRQTIERLSLRGIAVPQRADFTALMHLLMGDTSSSLHALNNLKTLDLSYNTFSAETAMQLHPLLATFQRLENLSLESCFPDPAPPLDPLSSIGPKAVEESVAAALTEVGIRLESLNFGSNWVPVEPRWLDALFTPGSTLQRLNLHGMSSASISVSETTETMEVDWQVGESWDLQQIETLKWSSSSSVHTEKLFHALSAELQSGLSQLKHLDLEVNALAGQDDGSQTDRKAAETFTRVADYAGLKSCRLCYYSQNAVISHGLSASVGRLLGDGFPDCEMLSLRIPQLYLSPGAIHDLLSSAAISNMRKMTLAIGIVPAGHGEQTSGPCFLQMQSMRELTLEFHVIEHEQTDAGVAAIALARELERCWLALSSSHAGNFTKDKTRAVGSATGKLNRSFVLSEQQKANKRIYRCHFSATSTP